MYIEKRYEEALAIYHKSEYLHRKILHGFVNHLILTQQYDRLKHKFKEDLDGALDADADKWAHWFAKITK